MSYRVEIRCDIGTGNRLEKLPCESLRGAKTDPPAGEYEKADHAAVLAKRDAESRGWIHKRRSGRPTAWICPACQVPE